MAGERRVQRRCRLVQSSHGWPWGRLCLYAELPQASGRRGSSMGWAMPNTMRNSPGDERMGWVEWKIWVENMNGIVFRIYEIFQDIFLVDEWETMKNDGISMQWNLTLQCHQTFGESQGNSGTKCRFVAGKIMEVNGWFSIVGLPTRVLESRYFWCVPSGKTWAIWQWKITDFSSWNGLGRLLRSKIETLQFVVQL